MSREDHRRHDAELLMERALQKADPPWLRKYGRDLVLAIIFALVPWGYGETEIIPRTSIWHPIVGWFLWAIPLTVLGHIAWMWLESKGWSRLKRISLMVTGALAFTFTAVMSVHAFIERQMAEEQNDVEQHLTGKMVMPSSGDLAQSFFTITNNGKATISANHQISCGTNLLVFNDTSFMLAGGINNRKTIPFPIEHNGDSQSEMCFEHLPGIRINCADMTLRIDYTLESQPTVPKYKEFRFVADQNTRMWREEALRMRTTPCEPFLPPDAKSKLHLGP